MTKKIFIIGGGVAASNYKSFEDYLLQEEFNPYEERYKGWKDTLQEDLGNEFEVIRIPMPNKGCAEYAHWKIMFEKAIPYFGKENIFVGHSLGGTFLLKYLSENSLENISQIHLVAPAVYDSPSELLGSFEFDKDLENFKRYESITTLYASRDDDVVSFCDAIYLQQILKAKCEFFQDMGHFICNVHFEKLVSNIQTS